MSSDQFPYATAQAFGAAITSRISAVAPASPYTASQLRRQFSYDRLLARLFTDPAGGWMLKGGIAMIARRPVARHSADIDLAARERSAADGLAALRAAAARDLGDHFTFRFDPPRTLARVGRRSTASLAGAPGRRDPGRSCRPRIRRQPGRPRPLTTP